VEEFIFLFQCLEEKKRVIFVAQIAISAVPPVLGNSSQDRRRLPLTDTMTLVRGHTYEATVLPGRFESALQSFQAQRASLIPVQVKGVSKTITNVSETIH
jgi:hypothetical protein